MLQKSFERQNISKLEGKTILFMQTYSSITADAISLILASWESSSTWKNEKASSQELLKQRYISFHIFCIWLDKPAKIRYSRRWAKTKLQISN